MAQQRSPVASGVGGQPRGQGGRALEVEQGHSCGEGCAYGQGLELLQGQGLDLGSGGASEGATAAVEEAEGGDGGSAIDLVEMADPHHQDHQFAALPFVDHEVLAAQGSGIARSRQILRTSSSLISLWRGMALRRFCCG